MARVIIPLAYLVPLLSDNSPNPYFGLYQQALAVPMTLLEPDEDGEVPAIRLKTRGKNKIRLVRVPNEDLPGIARMIAVHDLTAGDLTAEGIDCFLGLTPAKRTQPCELVAGKTWADMSTDQYPFNPITVSGTTKHWLSSGAISPNGFSVAQLKIIQAANGIQIKSVEQYRADLPVVAPLV